MGITTSHSSIAFTPDLVAGLVLWLRADQGTFQDSAMTVPATANNDPVGGMTDYSGQNNHATQAVNASRPTLKTNIVNSKPVIRFPGTGINMAVPSLTYRTVFVVTKFTGGATFSDYYAPIAGNAAGVITGLGDGRTNMWKDALTAWTSCWRNGSPRTTADVPTWPGYDFYPINTEFFLISAILPSGVTSAGLFGQNGVGQVNRAWIGDIPELLVYSGVLSNGNRQHIENYLIGRYALTTTYNPRVQDSYVADGDSLSNSSGISGPGVSWFDLVNQNQGKHFDWWMFGVGGQTSVQLLARESTTLAVYSAARPHNFLFPWFCINDFSNAVNLSAATSYANYVTYCQAAQAAGFKVIAFTMTDRTDANAVGDFNTRKATFSANVRANWATFADALCDVNNDANLGADGAANNLTYFNADKIHLTDAGYAIVGSLATTAVQSI